MAAVFDEEGRVFGNRNKGRLTLRRGGSVLVLAALLSGGVLASGALGMVSAGSGTTDSTATTESAPPETTSSDATATTTGSTTTDTPTTSPAPGPVSTPTISTDKADYAPGSTVTLTGSGWGAGESVHLLVNDDVGQTWKLEADVTADLNGAFMYQFQLPDFFIADYSVTATGAAGGTASAAFTDAVNLTFTGKDDGQHSPAAAEEDLGTVTAGTAVAATCPAGLNVKATGLGGASVTWAITYVSGYGNDSTLSGLTTLAPPSSTQNGSGVGQGQCVTLSIATGTLAGGTYHGELQVAGIGGASANPDFYFFKFTVATPVRASATTVARTTGTNPSVYGDALTFTATVTATGGNPNNAGTVSFKDGSTVLCNAVVLSGNTATCSLSLAAGAHSITAEYSGTTTGSPQFTPSASTALPHTVNKANQSITVTTHAPANATYDSSFTVAATGGASGNPVAFSSGGACSNSGALFTITSGTGTCTVKYDQAGDANYNAAPEVSETVDATKAAQSITVTTHAPASATYNSSFTVAATGGGSGNPVTFGSAGACSSSDAVFTMTSGTGTCTVAYDQAGDANYEAAPQVTESTTASKLSQTIDFGALDGKTFGDPDFPVSASGGGSGSPVTFTASGKCTVSGSTVHITGAGSCSITAHQAGSDDYDSAPDVTQGFEIAKADQSPLSVTSPDDGTFGQEYAIVTAGGSGTGAVSFDTVGSSACKIADGRLSITRGTGSCLVTATKAGDDDFNPIASLAHPVTVHKADQSPLSVTSPDDGTFGQEYAIETAGGSGAGAVSFDVGGSTACEIADGRLSITRGTGSCAVTATKAADDNYNPASSAAHTVTVHKADQSPLSVTSPDDGTYGQLYTIVTAGGSGTGAVSFDVGGGPTACEIAAGRLSITSGTGSCAVTATKAGDDNYNPASSAAHAVTVHKADQSPLSVTSPDDGTFGQEYVIVTAGGSGAGAVSFDVGASSACAIVSGKLSITSGTGSCAVTATKAGDDNYNPASSAAHTVTVHKANQSITFASLADKTIGDADFPISPTASSGLAVITSSASPGVCTVSAGTVHLVYVGTCTITAAQAGNADYNAAPGVQRSFKVLYRWDGFLQPINDTAHQIGTLMSQFKLGSTVPAKFQLKRADGTLIQAATAPTFGRSANLGACGVATQPESIVSDPATSGATYRLDSAGQQYIYNWSTKGLTVGRYRIYANLDDGNAGAYYVDICLN